MRNVENFQALNIPMIVLSAVIVGLMVSSERYDLIWALSLASFAKESENNGVTNKQNVIRLLTLDVLLHNSMFESFEILDILANSEVTMTVIIICMSIYVLLMDMFLIISCQSQGAYAVARTLVTIIITTPFIFAPILAIIDGLLSERAILLAFVAAEIVSEFSDLQVSLSFSVCILALARMIRLLKFHFYFRYGRIAVHNSYWMPGSPIRRNNDSSRRDGHAVNVLKCVPVI